MKKTTSQKLYAEIKGEIKKYDEELQAKNPSSYKRICIALGILLAITFILEIAVTKYVHEIWALVVLILFLLASYYMVKRLQKMDRELKDLRAKQIEQNSDISEMALGDAVKNYGFKEDKNSPILALYLLKERKTPHLARFFSVLVTTIFICIAVYCLPAFDSENPNYILFVALVVANLICSYAATFLIDQINSVHQDSFDYYILNQFSDEFKTIEDAYNAKHQ